MSLVDNNGNSMVMPVGPMYGSNGGPLILWGND